MVCVCVCMCLQCMNIYCDEYINEPESRIMCNTIHTTAKQCWNFESEKKERKNDDDDNNNKY